MQVIQRQGTFGPTSSVQNNKTKQTAPYEHTSSIPCLSYLVTAVRSWEVHQPARRRLELELLNVQPTKPHRGIYLTGDHHHVTLQVNIGVILKLSRRWHVYHRLHRVPTLSAAVRDIFWVAALLFEHVIEHVVLLLQH